MCPIRRNARRSMSGGVGRVGNRSLGDISAQKYGLFGYFDCISSMISASSGDSKILGPGSLLADGSTTSSTTKDAGILPGLGPPLWCTNCRIDAPKRLARGLLHPKAYNLALSWTGT